MSRTQLEMMANLLVVLYLVTHGVSVPAEERGHLVSGFYLSVRAWVAGKVDRLVSLLDLTGQLADA
jgi:Na+-translocating ferredoxin:NAD+ oxidoreductase RnfD subunit